MEITFNISKLEYPSLFKIKKEELNDIIYSIFNTGYNIIFPQPITINSPNYEYMQIANKLDLLKNNIDNDNLNKKISSLENSLEKLIGLSNSSVKKGELAENILENIFNTRYGDIDFENTTHIPHSGDAWLHLPNDKIIMIESKNYINKVNKDEVIKLQNDMIANHIKWGLFLSFNSSIKGMKEIDFNMFSYNSENYHIIFVSNLSQDMSKLDFSLNLIRKLLNTYSDLEKFPWIVNNIKSELTNLNNVLEQNYLLRDHFIIMEKDIIKNINTFYINLRDYQFNLDTKIKDIIDKITLTMNDSIEFNSIDYNSIIFMADKKDKKLGYIATKITDVMRDKNIYFEHKDNNIVMSVYGQEIGIIKIQNKKISIEFIKYDIILNFIIGKEKETLHNLVIFKNLNL